MLALSLRLIDAGLLHHVAMVLWSVVLRSAQQYSADCYGDCHSVSVDYCCLCNDLLVYLHRLLSVEIVAKYHEINWIDRVFECMHHIIRIRSQLR